MQLEPYDIRDHAELIRDIAAHVPLTEGSAHLALVAETSTRQEVVRVDTLDQPAMLYDYTPACDEMREVIDRWPIETRGVPHHSGVLVVIRRGLCVLGPNEGEWCRAWRYVNHFKSLFNGNLILVTEHGWIDQLSNRADRSPALSWCG